MRLTFFYFAVATDTGCGNKVQISEVPSDSEIFSQSVPPADLPTVQKSCASIANHSTQTTAFSFAKPTFTCEWGKNGNLGKRDQFFQARIEEEQLLKLPPGAIICDIKFEFNEQPFLYDDHFLMTFNNAILASSYDFQSKFSRSFGLLRYNWAQMAGMAWDKSKEGVYCGGGGNCSWPKTDTKGTIVLSYQTLLFQRLMAEDITRNEHSIKFVSIGDNDDKDCEHSDVNFTLQVDYVVPQ